MSALTDFLLENPVDNLTEQVMVSRRLRGMPFTIRAMTGSEFAEYQKRSTLIQKGRKVEFDSKRFNECIVIGHTIEPNFKDAELLKRSGCVTPEQLLNKVLLAGEIAELSQRISDLSGFGQSVEDMVEEAKN